MNFHFESLWKLVIGYNNNNKDVTLVIRCMPEYQSILVSLLVLLSLGMLKAIKPETQVISEA